MVLRVSCRQRCVDHMELNNSGQPASVVSSSVWRVVMFCRRVITFIFISVSLSLQKPFTT